MRVGRLICVYSGSTSWLFFCLFFFCFVFFVLRFSCWFLSHTPRLFILLTRPYRLQSWNAASFAAQCPIIHDGCFKRECIFSYCKTITKPPNQMWYMPNPLVYHYVPLACDVSIAILSGSRQANLVLSPMRAAKVQASLRIRAVSPEPPLLAHTGSKSRGTFRQKARSLAPLNGLACAVKICHDGKLEDTNSLESAQVFSRIPHPGPCTAVTTCSYFSFHLTLAESWPGHELPFLYVLYHLVVRRNSLFN